MLCEGAALDSDLPGPVQVPSLTSALPRVEPPLARGFFLGEGAAFGPPFLFGLWNDAALSRSGPRHVLGHGFDAEALRLSRKDCSR